MLSQVLILFGSTIPFFANISNLKSNGVCDAAVDNALLQFLLQYGFSSILCQGAHINLIIHACNSILLYYLIGSANSSNVDKSVGQRSALVASLYFALHPSRIWSFKSSISSISFISIVLVIVGLIVKLKASSTLKIAISIILTATGLLLSSQPILLFPIFAIICAVNCTYFSSEKRGSRLLWFGSLLLVGGSIFAYDFLFNSMQGSRLAQLLLQSLLSVRGTVKLIVNIALLVKTQFSFQSLVGVSVANAEPWLKSFLKHNKLIEGTIYKMIVQPTVHFDFAKAIVSQKFNNDIVIESYAILIGSIVFIDLLLVAVLYGGWRLLKKKSKGYTLVACWISTLISYVLLCLPFALKSIELLGDAKRASVDGQRGIEQKLLANWAEGAYVSSVLLSIALGVLLVNYFKKSLSKESSGKSNSSNGSPKGLAGIIWRVLPYFLLILGLQTYFQTSV